MKKSFLIDLLTTNNAVCRGSLNLSGLNRGRNNIINAIKSTASTGLF